MSDYANCDGCGTQVLRVQAHRFEFYGGRKWGTYCRACCPRCES